MNEGRHLQKNALASEDTTSQRKVHLGVVLLFFGLGLSSRQRIYEKRLPILIQSSGQYNLGSVTISRGSDDVERT